MSGGIIIIKMKVSKGTAAGVAIAITGIVAAAWYFLLGRVRKPAVTLTTSNIAQGIPLAWSISGFPAYAFVQVGTGISSSIITVDSNGFSTGMYDTTPLTPGLYEFQAIQVVSLTNPTSVQPPVFASQYFTVT